MSGDPVINELKWVISLEYKARALRKAASLLWREGIDSGADAAHMRADALREQMRNSPVYQAASAAAEHNAGH